MADPTADDLKANQVKNLDNYRKNPAQLTRSTAATPQHSWRCPRNGANVCSSWIATCITNQPHRRARLKSTLERYARWLERLPESDRRDVANAPDTSARLALIRELRDREWMDAQPRVVRDQWNGLKGGAKTELLAKLRLEERQRHRDWRLAVRFWKDLIDGKALPTRLADLQERDQEAVGEYLMPLLTRQDRLRLNQGCGHVAGVPGDAGRACRCASVCTALRGRRWTALNYATSAGSSEEI